MWGPHAFLVVTLVACAKGNMTGYVIGGKYTDIMKFPHSTFLLANCIDGNKVETYACGSSILNQEILLTAAQCVKPPECQPIIISVSGHVSVYEGVKRNVDHTEVHKNYNEFTGLADIALAHVDEPLVLGPTISRAVLVPRPPYNEPATVAGWGTIQDASSDFSTFLKSAKQKIMSHGRCVQVTSHNVPFGTICGTTVKKNDHPGKGDSGSALVTRDSIQIGITSLQYFNLKKPLMTYTDVGAYYDWIIDHSKKLVCIDENA